MAGFCTVLAGSTCRAIVQALPYAVVLLDEQLRVVLANRAAASLLSVTTDQLRGMPITSFVAGSSLDTALREFGRRRTKTIETCLPSAVRGRAPLTLKISAVRLAQWGSVVGGVTRRSDSAVTKREFRLLVLEDISERMMLDQQLVETEKQAAMGLLAAGILHEVSNPVTSMGSHLTFVRDAIGPSASHDVRQAIDASLDQLDQMRQLLGTLSAFPGRPSPRYEPADVHDVVRRCVTFVAREAERRGIHTAVSFAPSVIPCEMDVRLIKQVLINLLKNAMEAMPRGGGVEVRTSYRLGRQQVPDAVVIEVADTGTGISESDLRKVFRPLFSTKARGVGLGLSFCRQAVEEHGGEIRLASRGADRGTVATISLPIRQATID